jgi:hypothetical protein
MTPQNFRPTSDKQVLERVGPRKANSAISPSVSTPNVEQVAQAALEALANARDLADPRYIGRAQAMLAPWWNRDDASAQIAWLQASIEQTQHQFEASRASLKRALKRLPMPIGLGLARC